MQQDGILLSNMGPFISPNILQLSTAVIMNANLSVRQGHVNVAKINLSAAIVSAYTFTLDCLP